MSISLLVHIGFYSVHTGADAGAKFLTDKMNMVPTMQLYIHIATRKDPALSFSPSLSTSIGQSFMFIIPLTFFFLLFFSSVLLSSPLPFPFTLPSYPILSYPILSYPILSYPILSCPDLHCSAMYSTELLSPLYPSPRFTVFLVGHFY